MKKRNKFLYRLIAVFIVIVLMFTMVPFATIPVSAAGQTSITLKQGEEYSYTAGWGRSVVPMTADGEQVYCVQPDLPAPPNGEYRTDNGKLTEITSTNSKYTMYRKALYYCYGGDGFKTSNNAFKTDSSKHIVKYSGNTPSSFMGNLKWSSGGSYYTSLEGSKLHYMYTHLLLSYIYYGESKYKSIMGTFIPYNGYYEQIKELYDAIKKAPEPVVTTKLYLLNIGSAYQKVIVQRSGIKLQLQKSSANDNVSYSLAGARYNIYLDRECTDYFGYITTNESGYGKYGAGADGVDVPLQTYYCKEVESPLGYALDPNVYEFTNTDTIADGSIVYRVNVSDVPLIKLQLQKSSANPSLTDDNECYSLEGAKYNIYLDRACTNYYGYITTDVNGYGRFGTGTDTNTDVLDKDMVAYKKNSGESVPLDSGVTYYCKEAPDGAPKGYDVNDMVYQFNDTGSVSSDGIKIYRAVSVDDGVTQPTDEPINDPIGIKLQKRNAITGETVNQGLEGAIFQVQYYTTVIDMDCDIASNETAPALDSSSLKRTWYIKTDELGRAILDNQCIVNDDHYASDEFYYQYGVITLPIGTVVIKEVEAPAGYFKSDTVFYRRITAEGANTAFETNTPINVPIDEQPANGYIGIHKMNNSREGVAGATYGLYSDSTATTLVSTLVTDANGEGIFNYEAAVNKTFYIKEITAPAGYPLDTTIYPVVATENNTTVETAVIQDIYEESVKGDILIQKSSNDGVVKNLYFAITDNLGNEYNAIATDEFGKATVTGLPVYDANGKYIQYTVKELGFKTTLGTHNYGGFSWTVKAENCVTYKGVYYEGVANDTFSDCEYAYSRYYYGNTSEAVNNAKGYTKTLVDNGTVTYSFVNTVPTTDVEVYKDSYDGVREDLYFSVQDQFGKVYGNIKTDSNGYASYSKEYSKMLYSYIQIPNSAICIPLKYKVVEIGFKSPGNNYYYFPDNYSKVYESELLSADVSKSKSVLTFDAYNYADTGKINIVKSSDDGDIANLCFLVSAYEDETAWGGDIYETDLGYDVNGDLINSFILVTDENGYATSDDIELYDMNGNAMDGLPVYVLGYIDTEIVYEITELGYDNGDGTYTLPARYVKNEPVRFNMLENRSYTYNCHNSIIPAGSLQITKTADDNEVEGLWFNVSAASVGVDINVVTDEHGLTPVINDLPIYVPSTQSSDELVEYTVKELGYANGDGTYSLPYRYKSNKKVTLKLDSTVEINSVSFHNKLKTGSVTLNKQDYKGNTLSGSQWNLYSSDGVLIKLTQTGNGNYIYSTSGKVTTASTSSSGKLYISSLPQGDYYFIESKAPNGTSTYGKKIEFTVSGENAQSLSPNLTVKDDKIILFDTGGKGSNNYYLLCLIPIAISIAFLMIYTFKNKQKTN